MQQILFLRSVLQHHFNKEAGNLLHLEEDLFLKDIGSYKNKWIQLLCLDEEWSKVTSAAKAEDLMRLTAGINACSTP